MSTTSSQIRIIFDGTAKGVIAAAAQAHAAISGLDDDNSRLAKSSTKAASGLVSVGKGMAVIGAAGGAVKVIGGVVGAVEQLAPVALLLPAALLGGAAAMSTFKIATAGMGDALKAGLAGDMEKFTKATKDMAPAMQAAAKSVVAFKPQVDALKKSVQGEFWAGLNTQIEKTGKNLLPALQREMPGVAQGFNQIAKSALAATQTGFFKSDIQIILFNTGKALKNMSAAAGDALAGFVSLGAAGSSFLPRLGAAIDAVAAKFRSWVDQSRDDGSLDKLIEGAIQGFQDLAGIIKNVGSILGSVFTGLGGVIESPLARLRELTGQVAEFLKTVEAQEGLHALGDALQTIGDVVGRVVMTALRELMPTLVALAPVAKEVATTLGDLLVSALETLGPIIRGIADGFSAFPGSAGLATTAVVGFVTAIKAIKTVNAVTDLLGLQRAFGGVGTAAGEAGKTAGITWGKGFVGTLGLIGVGVAGTILLDKILPKDAAKTHGSQAARDMLGEMAAVFSGSEGNIFRQWDVAKWISNPIAMAVEAGSRELLKLAGFAPPPIPVHVDVQPATAEFNAWNDHVGDSIATANLDADPTRAQGVVHDWEGGVSRTRGTASLDADASRGNNVLAGWKSSADGTTGTAKLNANPVQADGTTSGWQGRANGTVGVARLNATPDGADQQLGGWKARANGTTGTAHLNAEPGGANATTSGWQSSANRATGTAHLAAEDSSARGTLSGFLADWGHRVLTWTVNILTGSTPGGPLGKAAGGPIYGPGTGTSDTAGIFALSRGEHVLTAREVQAAGGHSAIMAFRRGLSGGRIPRMSARSGRAAAGGSVSSSGALSLPTPQVSVAVHVGDQVITDLVRTEIDHSNRQTRRTVGAGAGTTF